MVGHFTVDQVFFDLDGTLLDHRVAAESAVVEWVRSLGREDNPAEIIKRWNRLEHEYFPRFERGEMTFEEQRIARIRSLLGDPEMPAAQAAKSFDDYRKYYENNWRAFPDALPAVVRCLAAGVRVGVITNGDPTQQMRKVAVLGLPFEPGEVIVSGALGVAKPDPQIFIHACQTMNVKPARVLMVGDDAVRDVQGAQAAGLQAVLVDRQSTAPQEALANLDGLSVSR